MFGRRSRMGRRPTRGRVAGRMPSRTPTRGRPTVGRTPTRRTPTRAAPTRTPVRGQQVKRITPRVGPRQEMPTRSRRTSTSRMRREMPTRSRGSSARARSYMRSMFRNRRR